MKHVITLVQLSTEQIALAKEANGQRKEMTHGLVCGPHGQLFGTEKKCRKYYSAWVKIFPYLFEKGIETKKFNIPDYRETFNLVNLLIELHTPLERAHRPSNQFPCIHETKKNKSGILSRLWDRVTKL